MSYEGSDPNFSQSRPRPDHQCYLLDNCELAEQSGLKCMHLNVSTLLPNIDELKHVLSILNIDILSLNETRLDNRITDKSLDIENYSLFRKDRNRSGGGVALYVKKSLLPSPADFVFKTEFVSVYISVKNVKLAIASIYRPPSSSSEYFNNIVSDIDKIISIGYKIILLGDLNFNYLHVDGSYDPNVNFLEEQFDLKQLIKTPTRVTVSSKSIIDHIYISDNLVCKASGALEISISDHYAVFASFNLKKQTSPPRIIQSRNFKHFNQANFISDLIN